MSDRLPRIIAILQLEPIMRTATDDPRGIGRAVRRIPQRSQCPSINEYDLPLLLKEQAKDFKLCNEVTSCPEFPIRPEHNAAPTPEQRVALQSNRRSYVN